MNIFTWTVTGTAASLLIGWIGQCEQAKSAERPRNPNIIIMMADDMGIGDTSAYLGLRLMEGSPPIEKTLRTPNLDKFARSATIFTDAHAPASMCSSTRYSLLTGRFAHRAYLKHQGWLPHGPNTPMIQRALTTLPEMLQANGYHTAGIGKYHVGISFDDGEGNPADDFHFHDVDFTKPLLDGPTHHGFDEYFGVPGNTEDPLDTEPRVMIRNDRLAFTDRSRMRLIGMKKREGRILAAPDWDLHKLGALYLQEAEAIIDRQSRNATQPFFIYYVPNANHFQRNPEGNYAVPDAIAGTNIKGESRYTNGDSANDREDMVLENDVAFGKLLAKLQATDDPRWPDHKLIDNTLIIFTSDNGPNTGNNLGRNQESGGLRGKKAKLWEGGIRVPFLVSWPGVIEGGKTNRSIVSLTDLYATLARVVGHRLEPTEAQDSHDVFDYWIDNAESADERPRVFFCHLGPPYANDALAIRQGPYKLIVDGGLAMPWTKRGALGASIPKAFYNLSNNLDEDDAADEDETMVARLTTTLLEIHNRGYCRDLNLQAGSNLILDPGWHNLRNDVTGEIGFEFRLRETTDKKHVTHLGMWEGHKKDVPVRDARAIPTEHGRDQPSLSLKRAKKTNAAHTLRLVRVDTEQAIEVARCEIFPGTQGEQEGSFRYARLEKPTVLHEEATYILLMSTRAGDGDHFHDPTSFDGLSPLVHPDISVGRGVLVRSNELDRRTSLPTFADLDEPHSSYRLPVGPTLKFR